MDADLVVLRADPEHDATAFSKVRYTILNGKLIYSEKGSLKRVRNPSFKSGYLRDQKAVTLEATVNRFPLRSRTNIRVSPGLPCIAL